MTLRDSIASSVDAYVFSSHLGAYSLSISEELKSALSSQWSEKNNIKKKMLGIWFLRFDPKPYLRLHAFGVTS